MEPLGESIKKIMAKAGRTIQEPAPPACETCKDVGCWGIRSRLDHEGEAQATSAETYCIRCPMGKQVALQHEAAKVATRQAEIDRRLAHVARQIGPGMSGYTLKSYVERGGHPDVAKLMIEWLDLEPVSFYEGEPAWLPWLYVGGSVGAGKTGAVVPVMMEYVRRGIGTASFLVVSDWLESIRMQYGGGKPGDDELPPMYAFQDKDLLVLDDLGVERNTDWSTEQLFMLINYRATERKRTIITSNLSLDALRHRLDPGDRGRRIPSRIQEMCWGDRWVLRIDGRDLRLQKSPPEATERARA